MGAVVPFRPRRHDRARAARSAKASAVKPACLATLVFRIEPHHPAGILFRYGHLRAANLDAPISSANSSGVGHSATTSRNDCIVIPECIGQPVFKVKPNLSDVRVRGHHAAMAKPDEFEYNQRLFERTTRARESVRPGFTQADMADLLLGDRDLQSTYSKYEYRTPLPHYLIPKFCDICRISCQWLFTGRGQAPAEPQPAPQVEKKQARAPRQQRQQKIA